MNAGKGEIVVSAGGGDVGAKLFKTAIAAAVQDPKRTWRILVGGANAQTKIKKLIPTAPANVQIEAARPDFRQVLNHANVSVSMCGYNTALDILQTGVSAVFVPFDAGGEVEQSLRAKALSEQSNIAVLKDADLSVETLILAIQKIQNLNSTYKPKARFDGATTTVNIIEAMLSETAHDG